MDIDLSKFSDLLDKPGTGMGREGALNAISGPKLGDQADMTAIGDQATDDSTATSSADNDDVLSDKEERVPKSRFLKRDRELMEERHARQLLEKDFQRLESELQAVKSTRSSTSEGGAPKWWTDQWGDGDEAKAAWNVYDQTMKEQLRSLREDMRQEEQYERQQRVEVEQQISDTFDTQLEELEDTLGKSLSDKQAAELLTIVEKYSPTDSDGNFESFISLDKAYEIYDLQQRGGRNESKDRLSRIAATTSQGDSNPAPSSKPPQWGDWRTRLGG